MLRSLHICIYAIVLVFFVYVEFYRSCKLLQLATRMAAHFGKIGEFDEKQEEWTQYVERLDHFYAANEIDNTDKKRAILLTIIGPTAYKLLRNFVAPAKTYDALVTAMKQHHNPTLSEIVQHYMFNSHFRQPGEQSRHICLSCVLLPNTVTTARHWIKC